MAGHGKTAQQSGAMVIAASGDRNPPAGTQLGMPPARRPFIPFGHDAIPYLQAVKGKGKAPFPWYQRAERMVDDTESAAFPRLPEKCIRFFRGACEIRTQESPFYAEKAGMSLVTVSYTHLDVYKRQGLKAAAGKRNGARTGLLPLWIRKSSR